MRHVFCSTVLMLCSALIAGEKAAPAAPAERITGAELRKLDTGEQVAADDPRAQMYETMARALSKYFPDSQPHEILNITLKVHADVTKTGANAPVLSILSNMLRLGPKAQQSGSSFAETIAMWSIMVMREKPKP